MDGVGVDVSICMSRAWMLVLVFALYHAWDRSAHHHGSCVDDLAAVCMHHGWPNGRPHASGMDAFAIVRT